METWAIDAVIDGKPLALVLRRDMGANMFSGALTRAQEFELIAVAHAHGVMAPRPHFANTDTPRPFFLMERLPGEGIGRKIVKLPELAAARMGLAAQMGEQLARIHAIPVSDALAFLARPTGGSTPAAMALTTVRDAMAAAARDNPAWEYALRWLTFRAPSPSGPLTVVHGDFRIGNLLVTTQGLSGVLDWEFAHVGDPLEDLAWPLLRDWRFENDALRVGGVGAVDDFLAAYEHNGGRRVEPAALKWWEILGNLRWAVFCHAQADRHLSGRDRSVELASLGRKASEMEWELIDLIDREEAHR
jgi:aminoglycoside phosphotransferase (APT) family kinase protein